MDDYLAKPFKSRAIFDAPEKYCPGLPGEDNVETEEFGEIEREDKPVLNPSQLLDIGDHDEELILELIDEFINDAPALLDMPRDQIDSGDPNRITIKAHKLNGLAARRRCGNLSYTCKGHKLRFL